MISDRIRPRSSSYLLAKTRARRWDWLAERFPDIERMRVLDLGGTVGTWNRLSWHPAHVTVVNLRKDHDWVDVPWADIVVGDAVEPPTCVTEQHWDLVFSNSLIEHLGGYEPRRKFAQVVHDLASHYWVQTPYRYFPIEPHWWFPGFQFLPLPAKARIAERWPYGNMPRDEPLAESLWVELLTRTEMRLLFPDGDLLLEKLGKLTKSLILTR